METNQNMLELKDDFTQNNMVNNLELFDNQKITETIYDPNAITNQEPIKDQNIAFPPSTDFNQNTAEEVPYTLFLLNPANIALTYNLGPFPKLAFLISFVFGLSFPFAININK